jgi:hypothetical protein
MLEMFGLNRPLPTTITESASLNMNGDGSISMNRPIAITTAPISTARW